MKSIYYTKTSEMENSKVIKITFKFLEKDEITHQEHIIVYEFESISNNLVVSVGDNNRIKIDGINNFNLEDINEKICDIFPDEINDMGASISLIEDLIINAFLKGDSHVDELNNSTFTFDYKPDYQETMILNCGKILMFPSSGSEYFNLTLKQLLEQGYVKT